MGVHTAEMYNSPVHSFVSLVLLLFGTVSRYARRRQAPRLGL